MESKNKNDDSKQVKFDEMKTKQDANNNIKEAFLNAIHLLVDDNSLPIENADFWNNYIVPCKNPDVSLDIKGSTYKKLGKFFGQMEKEGFLKYAEASKKNSTPQINRILRNNKQIENWTPTISKPKIDEEEEEDEENYIWIRNSVLTYCRPREKMKVYLEEKHR